MTVPKDEELESLLNAMKAHFKRASPAESAEQKAARQQVPTGAPAHPCQPAAAGVPHCCLPAHPRLCAHLGAPVLLLLMTRRRLCSSC